MAKSSTYFGLRRGSTKSHTFSVVDGKQITKDRVEGGKDPRTLPQMTQRCLVATIGTAYSAMKGICDHSFEGKSAGLQCMRAFMSTNLKQIQISKEYGNGLFGFNKYHQPGLVPGCYIIADGSLPVALADAEVDSVNVADKKLSLNLASGISIADIAEAMGCHPEAEIVFANSESNAGNLVSDVHEGLIGETDLRFTDQMPFEDIDVVFFCFGHGKSEAFLQEHTIPSHVKIIDLAQDFRIQGNHDYVYGLPEINKALVHVEKYGNKLLVTSCIDNLLKGAIGQAVQNMNIMFGIDETAGLKLKASAF